MPVPLGVPSRHRPRVRRILQQDLTKRFRRDREQRHQTPRDLIVDSKARHEPGAIDRARGIPEMEDGLIEADLGGLLYKKRVARPGGGKSGGYRTVLSVSAAEIKRLRERLKFSQAVFAHLLHTTASTVRKWEQGETRPAGPALKLLSVIADKGLDAVL